MTNRARAVLEIALKAGAKDYAVTRGRARVAKVARLSLPNGYPVVIQLTDQEPRIWMLPEHERGLLSGLGPQEQYAIDRPRHSNLKQVREFRNRELVKTVVSTHDLGALLAAVCAIGMRSGPPK
jgi:hypothetical protein